MSLVVWKRGIHTNLDHMANHTLMCLARVPFEVATHAHVLGHAKPIGYTDLCNTAKSYARV
ncbi:hypothetical protein F383_17924 [Gossypium arboreum]|uniref:Uncharacterized protein n=1 Tax=Gossypium arboreum TaxID=29729 RepID=A0A0B0NJF9_GOSAR|nr:hypothetical protein F383_17924 [Gossypium arboreum]